LLGGCREVADVSLEVVGGVVLWLLILMAARQSVWTSRAQRWVAGGGKGFRVKRLVVFVVVGRLLAAK
jgi:hypothetical protein